MSISSLAEEWVLANLAIRRASGGGCDYASISNQPGVERKLRAAIQAGHIRLRGRVNFGPMPVEIPTPLTDVFRLDLGFMNQLTLGLRKHTQTFTNLEIEWISAEPYLQTVKTAQREAPEQTPSPRRAPATKIHEVLQTVYDDAARTGEKAPNVREVVGLVQTRLAEQDFTASGRQIQKAAEAPEFSQRRRKPGHRL